VKVCVYETYRLPLRIFRIAYSEGYDFLRVYYMDGQSSIAGTIFQKRVKIYQLSTMIEERTKGLATPSVSCHMDRKPDLSRATIIYDFATKSKKSCKLIRTEEIV